MADIADVVRYRVRVSGRVQGVWFRESCRREAIAAGVTGWVRNNGDGTVEAVLQGEPAAVARLRRWMRSGPPRAVVTHVDEHPEPPGPEQDFTVLPTTRVLGRRSR